MNFSDVRPIVFLKEYAICSRLFVLLDIYTYAVCGVTTSCMVSI